MILVIDIGNTATSFGLYNKYKLAIKFDKIDNRGYYKTNSSSTDKFGLFEPDTIIGV